MRVLRIILTSKFLSAWANNSSWRWRKSLIITATFFRWSISAVNLWLYWLRRWTASSTCILNFSASSLSARNIISLNLMIQSGCLMNIKKESFSVAVWLFRRQSVQSNIRVKMWLPCLVALKGIKLKEV